MPTATPGAPEGPALFARAAEFAARKHRSQRRKNGDIPYIEHPLAVARILAEEAGIDDPAALAAAALHDTIEDTDTTYDELLREFGEVVADLVREVSDDKSLPKVERKLSQVRNAPSLSPAAKALKLADKIHNLRDLLSLPPANWSVARVRGYFVWSEAVSRAIGGEPAALQRALQALFSSPLADGVRAVPEDPGERERVLADYYEAMRRSGSRL